MIYADTSVLVAGRVYQEPNFKASASYYEATQDDVWLWSPWHRVEVFNSIRQLVRHPENARRLKLTEARALINRIETDVRLGYLTHMEADWRDVFRTANELSIAHGFNMACRAADLLHVAYAKELGAETFASCDGDQLTLAEAAGLKTVNPSPPSRRAK
jgi:predicted nucleic acid-binding protein